MTKTSSEQPRAATEDDGPRLLSLWSMLFDDDADEEWKANAIRWFARSVGGASSAWFPVIEVQDDIVATAIGTLEMGVPNPHCPQGLVVRLANVITLPEHRGHGHGTALVL